MIKRITHLNLNDKGIVAIENLDDCTNLQVVVRSSSSSSTSTSSSSDGRSRR